MRILMTTDTIGGVWSYTLQLAGSLQQYGDRVEVAALGSPNEAQRQAAEMLPNVTLHESGFRLEWMEEPWEDVRAAGLWLLRLAREVDPDIVHLNDYAHGAHCWPAPVVVVGHSCVLSWHRAVRGTAAGPEWDRYRENVAQGLGGADLVVAPTAAMLRSLIADYGPFKSAAVIYNGRDCAPDHQLLKQSFILTAGRLWDEAKNLQVLDAAAATVNWPVYAAGDVSHPGGGTAEFRNVHALGRLSPAVMENWLQSASIYVHPAKYEPFGLAPLEAAQCGCALVLADIPTLREIWRDSAVYVSPDRPDALVAALNRLIENPELRRIYSQLAHERSARFTAGRMARSYRNAYRQLLSASRRPVKQLDSAACE